MKIKKEKETIPLKERHGEHHIMKVGRINMYPYLLTKKQLENKQPSYTNIALSSIFVLSGPYVVVALTVYLVLHLLVHQKFIWLPEGGYDLFFYSQIILVVTSVVGPYSATCLEKYFTAWGRSRDMGSLVTQMASGVASGVVHSNGWKKDVVDTNAVVTILYRMHFLLRSYMYAVKYDLTDLVDIEMLPVPKYVRDTLEKYTREARSGMDCLTSSTTYAASKELEVNKAIVPVIHGVLSNNVSELLSLGLLTGEQDHYVRKIMGKIQKAIGQMGNLFQIPYATQLIQLLIFVVPIYVLTICPLFYITYGPWIGGVTYMTFAFGISSIVRASSAIQNPLERPEIRTHTSSKRISEIYAEACMTTDVVFGQAYFSLGYKVDMNGMLIQRSTEQPVHLT